MTDPQGFWGGPRLDSLEAEVRELKAELAELRNKGTRNTGALTIKAPNGSTTFSSGPNTTSPMPDGTPQWVTVIRDTTGLARFTFWDPAPAVDGYVQALYMYDHLGQNVWTTDNNGGWAEPWLPVPMYQQFPVTSGDQWVDVATLASEQRLYRGTIPYVSHPNLGVSGVWGQRTGAGQTTRYRLKVGGSTVGTWDISGGEDSDKGPFSIASRVNDKQVLVEVTAQSLAGSGTAWVQLGSVHLRQT